MNTFKTPKGTELPLTNLKGKSYLSVAYRVLWFREIFPLGRIDTQALEKTDNYVVYTATVSVPNEKGDYVKLADALKREDYAHFADANEKAQTGAIGRALGLCGFGTQFAHELSEEDRVVDAPLEKAKAESKTITDDQRKLAFSLARSMGWADEEIKGTWKSISGKETSKEWTQSDLDKVLGHMKSVSDANPQMN